MSSVNSARTPAAPRRSFTDLSVNVKVLSAIGLAALVAVVVGVTGLVSLNAASDSAQLIYNDNVTAIKSVGDIKAAVMQARVDVTNQALSQDQASSDKFTNAFGTQVTAFDTAMSTYRATGPAADAATIDDLQGSWQTYVKIAQEQLLPAGNRHDLKSWSALRDNSVLPLMTKMYAEIQVLDHAETVDAAKNATAAASGYRSSRVIALVTLVVGLILALGMGLVVARGLVLSLTKVRRVCEGLADGDLTRTTGLTSRDEAGQMGRALDTAMAHLRQTVKTIDGSAGSLAGASEQRPALRCRSPRRPRRLRHRHRRCPPQPSRFRAAWRRFRPAATRWVSRSGRSPRTPQRRPGWPKKR